MAWSCGLLACGPPTSREPRCSGLESRASMQTCDARPAWQENRSYASMQMCDARPALQENRSLLRTLDCFTEGMLILDTSTPSWQVLHANEAWSACTGAHSNAGVGPASRISGRGRARYTEGSRLLVAAGWNLAGG